MTKVSNCGHDENWRYSGGKAGDQTGNEWYIRDWYDFSQDCVLRHPDSKVRALIASTATEAANNDNIGYDQGQRETFWENLSRMGYIPSSITNVCEADCSSGVAAIVKAVGYRLDINALKGVPTYMYTGNEVSLLKAAGFSVLTDSRYLRNGDYLLAGDINVNQKTHTNICVTSGSKAHTQPDVPIELDVDGFIGIDTVSEWQRQMGTTIDGVVSGQLEEHKGAYPRLMSVEFGYGLDGSSLMKAVQKKIGIQFPTGIIANGTIAMLQSWLILRGYDCTGDHAGILEAATAKAVQTSLNNGEWK